MTQRRHTLPFIFTLSLFSIALTLSSGENTSSKTDTPPVTYTYTFDQEQGPERALGTLANPKNYDSMSSDSYNALDALDVIPFNLYDNERILPPEGPMGSVYVPTTIYRAQET